MHLLGKVQCELKQIDYICLKFKKNKYMSNNKNDTYKGVPVKKFEGKISDLGYKSGEELIENALKKFDAAVSKINREVFGYDIDYPK